MHRKRKHRPRSGGRRRLSNAAGASCSIRSGKIDPRWVESGFDVIFP